VLQVDTGMYFRDVPLHETLHRRVLYTNLSTYEPSPVELPVGTLRPSTQFKAVNTLTVEVLERLEGVQPNGQDEWLISTGGDELVEDLAMVLAFALNACVTSSFEKAQRLIAAQGGHRTRPAAHTALRRTFEPARGLRQEELVDLREFMTTLLALERTPFERAMRSMRRIVTASERIDEDPTTSYVDYVAALEALSAEFDPPGLGWQNLDSRKRQEYDRVLATLTTDDARAVREAVLRVEHYGLKHRFVEFVVAHVAPSYYRDEAKDVSQPVPASALRQVLKRAYDLRSRSVHELAEMPAPAWLFTDGAHVITPAGEPRMLSLEGLNRLARHVVRQFVERAPAGVDADYDYRSHLPNVMQVELAPEYFLHRVALGSGADARDVARKLIEHLREILAGRQDTLKVDFRPALEGIESTVPGRQGEPRKAMLATYLLWHRVTHVDLHRPNADATLALAVKELERPSLWAFAVAAMLDLTPPWTADDWRELAEERHQVLLAAKRRDLPSEFDSALWLCTANALLADGAMQEAQEAVARAVETTPGHPLLLDLEERLRRGEPLRFDLRRFVVDEVGGDERDYDAPIENPPT
jgi:hypothetical protein